MSGDLSVLIALSAEMTSPTPEVRWRVAAALADASGAEAEALLVRLAGDADYRVREKAVSILTRRFSPRIAQACVQELSRGGEPDTLSSCASVLGRAGAPGRPHLLGALSSEFAAVRLAAARSLPGAFADAPTVAALEAAMRLELDANVRAALVLAMGRSRRREALAPLLLELEGTDVWRRVHVVVALGEAGDPSVAPRLLPLLNDASLQDAALAALSRLETAAAAEELTRRASLSSPGPLLLSALCRAAASSAPDAAGRLAHLWPGAREMLVARLESEAASLEERTDAAHLLARLDLTGAAATLVRLGPFADEFGALVSLPRERFREALFAARESDDPEPALTLVERARSLADREALAGLLGHRSPLVTSSVLGALPVGSTPVAILVDFLSRRAEPETVKAAAFALAREVRNAPPDRARVCRNALLDRAAQPEVIAALALDRDSAAGAAVKGALVSPDPALRRAAAAGAGFRHDLGVEDLLATLRDEDPGVRAAALRSLTRWAERDKGAPAVERAKLLPHLAAEPQVAAAAGAALVAFAGAERPRIAIEMLAQRGPIRRAAVEEVSLLKDGAAADAIGFALSHEDPETARGVVKAMVHASPEVAAETLAQGLLDSRSEIRKSAAQAIAERGAFGRSRGPFAEPLAAALSAETTPDVVAALLEAVAVSGGASSIAPVMRALASEHAGDASERAAAALARKFPEKMRDAWTYAPPGAAHRLSAILSGVRGIAREVGEGLPPDVFSLFADLVRRRTGLSVGPALKTRLARGLAAEAAEAGSFARLYTLLREAPTESELFGRVLDLVAGRTGSFFEDSDALLALALEIAPERLLALSSDDSFDVWCAGCGSGEDVFSLAILLHERGIVPGYRVRLHGTDLSPEAIRRARERRYGLRALRGVSEDRRARYFEPAEGGLFRVSDLVGEPVSLAARGIFDEPRGGALFDAILCRNLLSAMEEDVRARAVETMAAFLKPGGYLLLGRHDGRAAASTPLSLVRLAHDIAYRR